ncbi:MAG: hypothetical protein FWC22_03125 [Treponema sp.]|nr:hypothetical protein [Treponema sp.]
MSKKNNAGKDAVDFLNEASDLMDRDNFKGAVGLLTEGISLCGHPRLFFNRGYCYHQLKDSKNAVKDFTKSIANDRGSDLLEHEKQRLYLYLGIIYEEINDEEKAVEAYKNSADRGYAGAITRLERLGISYRLRQVNEPQEQPAPKPATARPSQAKTATAAASKNASVASAPIKKSMYRFILPVVIGIIFGIGTYLLLRNIPEIIINKQAAIKPNVITATVTSDTLNLCAEPYAFSDVLKVLYNGYVLEITGDASGGFTPVEYEGVRGWVDSDWIDTRK